MTTPRSVSRRNTDDSIYVEVQLRDQMDGLLSGSLPIKKIRLYAWEIPKGSRYYWLNHFIMAGKNPLAKGAAASGATVTGGAKYQDLGYVGTGFTHKLNGPTGEFEIINISFDQATDFTALAKALSEGKLLSLRPRKVETRKVPNQAYAMVLREKVGA